MAVQAVRRAYLAAVLIICSVSADSSRGFIFTAPKRLLADSVESVCLSLHNVTEPAHVKVSVLHVDSDEKIAFTEHTIPQGVGSCLELVVPPTLHTRARLHLQVRFDHLADYVINSVKEVHIQHDSQVTFIQTDKPVYKPGQEVLFRVLTVRQDLTPVTEQISKVWIESPSEVRLAQWLNTSTELGLAQFSFQLSHEPMQGVWKIKVDHRGSTQSRSFEVREYVLPRFQVSVVPPDYVLADAQNLSWTVCAKYSYGQPVKGELHIKAVPQTPTWRQRKTKPLEIHYMAEVTGCQVLNLTGSELGLSDWDVAPNNIVVTASVTEVGTGVTQNASVTSSILHQSLKLEFLPHSAQYFKPGLPYKGKVKVLLQNNAPAPGEMVQLCLKVQGKGEWSRTLVVCKNFTSDSNGFVQFLVRPQHHNVVLLSFVATAVGYQTKYYSPDKRWRVFMDQPSAFFDVQSWYSPTNSYVQIADDKETGLECGSHHTFHVFYTMNPNVTRRTFYYLVKSRGDLIRMGRIQHHQKQKPTKLYEDFPNILGGHEDSADNGTESGGEEMMVGKLSLKLLVEPKMSPLSYLLVYYVREDGETVPATHVIQVDKCFANKVKASFQNDQGTPGSRASLHITASPHSLCAVAAVDESTNFLAASSALDSEWVFRELAHFHIDPSSGPRQKDVWDYCSRKTKASPPLEEEEIHRPVVEEEPPIWDLRRRRRRRFVATHPMSKYVDAIQAFDDFGVVVMSDLTLETRPCFSSGQGEVDADRVRPSDVRMHVIPGKVSNRRGRVSNRARGRSRISMSPLAYPLTVGVPTSPRGYSEGARQPSIEVRTFFPETWLWELIHIGKEGETVLKRDLPHTITDWVGSTVCVSAQHGLGVSSPAKVRAFQPFFLDYVMPYSIKRGEVVHLKVSLYNFLAHSLPVRINLEDSPGITLVSDSSTVLSCVQKKTTLVHKFLIRAAELGEVNVTVTAAVDPEYEEACGPELIIGTRDVLVKSILVKPEGFPVEVTKSSFMCPTEISNDTSMLWSIDLPEDVVKDSARAQISAVADLMGPTLQNLDNLVQLPMGCGEQNMILFVPNLHVINYLNVSQQENPVLKAEAVKNMEKGYQRELNYRHTDGSYSAFGNSDSSGSMWLTAFVVKSFAQARTHIFVDEDDLKMSIRWITKKQLENGCFPLVGQVFHKDMKGGLTSDTSSAALTAYVLISLLETGLPLAPSVASNAVFCLHGDKQPDVYTLALTTYAFSLLGNRTLAEESLRHLMGAATIQQDLIWWEKQDTNSLALNIETTAYGILSLVKLGGERNLIDALRAVRWISKHRNANGGFVSTQDTVVALEALTKYAMAVPSRGTHLSVLVAATDLEHVFHIRQHDRLLLKQRWLPTLPTQVEVVAEGEGCALIQSTLKYNVRTPSGSDAFSLEVETGPVASVDECTMQRVEVCVSYRLPGQISNMAVLEIAMVTGYRPDRDSLHKLDQDTELDLKRWEEGRDQVNFYFEQLTNRKQCVGFLVVQEVEVDNPAPALVKLYDYYQQELVISTKYSSDIGCKSERLPHPEPGVLNGNMALSQGSKDEELISNTGLNEVVLTIMQADTNDLNTTSESNSTGLNSQFVNVDHELETPSGQEGPEPVYVQPQGDNPQNIAERASTCPQCSNLDQDAFTAVYCNSSTVYKLTIRKGNTARILLKLAPGRTPTRIRRLTNLLLGKNCQCAPLAQAGGHVLMISSKPVTLTTETEDAMDLFLDDAIVVVSVAVQPGQPDIVKTARESCPAS